MTLQHVNLLFPCRRSLPPSSVGSPQTSPQSQLAGLHIKAGSHLASIPVFEYHSGCLDHVSAELAGRTSSSPKLLELRSGTSFFGLDAGLFRVRRHGADAAVHSLAAAVVSDIAPLTLCGTRSPVISMHGVFFFVPLPPPGHQEPVVQSAPLRVLYLYFDTHRLINCNAHGLQKDCKKSAPR